MPSKITSRRTVTGVTRGHKRPCPSKRFSISSHFVLW